MRKLIKPLRGFTRRKTLSLAAAVGVVLTASGPSAGAQGAAVQVARPTTMRAGDVLGAHMQSTKTIQITVALKLRNRDSLESLITTNSSRSALSAPKVMSADEIASQYLPTQAQTLSVVQFLRNAGFRNVQVTPDRMFVNAEATAAVIESTFNTTMMQVTTREGREAFANTTAVSIPAELQDTVLSVIGLQSVFQAHVMSKVLSPDALTPQTVTGHNPTEWPAIYGANQVATAAGVTVGIITQGSLTTTISDLNRFTANNGLQTVTTQIVNTNGTSTDTSGTAEWNLDSQDIVGMAGGQVGKIIFYNIPTLSNSNLTADFAAIVRANATKIINVSLGECETAAKNDGSAAAQDQSFMLGVAQGQTFSISTGDSGADECGDGGVTPSWPAASQYVVALSGTRLDTTGTTYNSEVVWNDLAAGGGATGGSQSRFEPKPTWQNNLVTGTTRGVADISYSASPSSGARVIVNGATQQIGGTSLSAPLFAGVWARVLAVKGLSVGFAAPLIYALPASDFHDVVTGNNGGSTARAGYDLATGLGSLILNTAINHIGGTATPPGTLFTNTTPLAIPDLTTVTSSIAVSGLSGPGPANLAIAVNITHTYRGDLKIDIIAPNGASANLFTGSANDSADNVITTFTVNASSLTTVNGTWKLRIQDRAAGDTGTLNRWSLQF